MKPITVVTAVIAVYALVFLFVFGPLGMIDDSEVGIHLAAYISPVVAMIGVLGSKYVAYKWQLHASHRLEKLTGSLQISLISSSERISSKQEESVDMKEFQDEDEETKKKMKIQSSFRSVAKSTVFGTKLDDF